MKASRPYILLAFATVFLVGILFGAASGRGVLAPQVADQLFPKPTAPGDVDFSLLWEVWDAVTKHSFAQQFTNEELVFGAAEGLVKATGDPYAEFFDPDDLKFFLEETSGSFGGIGIEIGIKRGVLTVIAPLKGTPAERAGIKAGDKIVEIDDVGSRDLTLQEAVSRIRGKEGTEVQLSIVRDELDAPQKFTITRETIQIPVLDFERKEGDIAYIALYNFSERSPQDFKKAAEKILAAYPKGLILDLRNNPGGFLGASVDIAGWFIPRGRTVVIEQKQSGERQVHASGGPASLAGIPLVIIINEGSASASEILAGALKEEGGGILVGTQSFGKGSVQELQHLSQGTALKITTERWLTPSGNSIEEAGITPDYAIEFTDQDKEAGRDPQLEKALELLR